MALTVHRFQSCLSSVTASLLAGVVAHDHIGGVAADAAQLWGTPASKVYTPAAAPELLRELGRMAQGDARDSATLRRAAAFVIDVSGRLPKVVSANIAVLLPFLECDSHMLRSALVNALGAILLQATSEVVVSATSAAGGGDGGDGSAAAGDEAGSSGASLSATARDTLYDVLAARAMDVHSFTRAAVLRTWTTLVAAAAVPAPRMLPLATLAAGRLADKGALVRRAAAGLLRSLVDNNPFGPRLHAGAFREQEAAAAAWLAAHPLPEAPRSMDALAASVAESEAAVAAAAAAGGGAAPAAVHCHAARAPPLERHSSGSELGGAVRRRAGGRRAGCRRAHAVQDGQRRHGEHSVRFVRAGRLH